eukprot:14128758-Alexandrium_andersonii.AAC.1
MGTPEARSKSAGTGSRDEAVHGDEHSESSAEVAADHDNDQRGGWSTSSWGWSSWRRSSWNWGSSGWGAEESRGSESQTIPW